MANVELGNAYLQIVPSARGIQKTLTNDVNGAAGNAGTTAGNTLGAKIKSALLAAGIGTALTQTIKSAINEGAALEQSIGGIEAIFGEAADSVKNYAADAWKTVGVSANQYMEGVTSFSAALIRDMGGDTEKAAEIANQAFIDMGDNANRFGKSVEEVSLVYRGLSKGQYVLLDNLNLGFAGSKEGMQELLAYASELSGVDYSIDSLADMYQAIHVVQEELNVTGTTAKEAATTLAGSTAAFKAAWTDLLGNMAIGGDISTPIDNLTTSLTGMLSNLVPMIGNVISELPGALFNLVSTLVPQALQAGTDFMNKLAEGVEEGIPHLAATGGTALLSFSQKLRSNFGPFVDAGLNLIKNIAKGIVNAIPTLIALIPQIVTNLAGLINDNAPKLFEAGKELLGTLWEGVKSMVTSIKDNWRNILNALLDVWEAINWIQLGKDAINLIKNGFNLLKENLPTVLRNIATKAWEKVKSIDWLGLGKSVIRFIANGIRSLANNIPDALRSIATKAKDKFTSIDWGQVGRDIINGIKNGIVSIGHRLGDAAKEAASNALGKVKNFLGINSPSKVFADQVGRAIPEGIALGIIKNADLATDAVTELGGELAGTSLEPTLLTSARAHGSSSVNSGGNTFNFYNTINGTENPEEYGRRLVAAAMLELRAQ